MPPEATAQSPLSLREAARQPLLGQQEVQNGQPKLNPQQRVVQLWAEGMGTPAFGPRQENASQFLAFGQDGRQHLVLPNDLHVWEVVPILKQLDALLPQDNRRERNLALEEIGTFMRNAGMYIATRIERAFPPEMTSDHLQRARQLAEQMAGDFFGYGTSLMTGEEPMADIPLEKILAENSNNPLSQFPEQEEAVARFLIGDNLYDHRLRKAGQLAHQDHTSFQAEQQKAESQTLRQFFRTVARAESLSKMNGQLKRRHTRSS